MKLAEIKEMNFHGRVLDECVVQMNMLEMFMEMKETLNGIRFELDNIKYELAKIEENTRIKDGS
jgi:hypothetical protein